MTHFSRRRFLRAFAVGCLAGCGPRGSLLIEPHEPTRTERIDQALTRAGEFLLKRQSDDGSWRSDHYGPFKDGGSLTPLLLRTLGQLPRDDAADAQYRKGVEYLAGLVQADGRIDPRPYGLTYPVYTAAGAVQVLSQPGNEKHRKALDGWLAYLRERQLTEERGWQPADKPYGGWGYCPQVPRKPGPGEPLHPLTESNISATVFALEAMRAAGVKANDPSYRQALTFIERCQNYSDEGKQRDERFDDGGFYFIYDDPVRNKAGAAGKDRNGQERYHSYGSTTADGWRALLLCGRKEADPRVRAARAWMEKHFRVDTPPGDYAEYRESSRGAVYYYYCCSLSQTLQQAGIGSLQTPKGEVRWAEALADELLSRQGKDGTWVNPLVPQREDDPLVATPLAVLALVHCRAALRATEE